MFVEDVNGNLVNLNTCRNIRVARGFVEAGSSLHGVMPSILFESDNHAECVGYMDELKKELAAFGKLIRVEMD